MAVKIQSAIVDYAVARNEEPAAAPGDEAQGTAPAPAAPAPAEPAVALETITEALEREEVLQGATYKIKTPLSEHALYVTINDVVLNAGTEHEARRPFEVFINSKNMDHYQWIVALTRIMSAVFRKGGDVAFMAEELSAVFDPKGGYFKRGGRYMPSLVAEIGDVIRRHLTATGVIEPEGLDAHQKALIAEKRAQYAASPGAAAPAPAHAEASEDAYPASAQMCPSCLTKAVVQMDGCSVCLCCSSSRCG